MPTARRPVLLLVLLVLASVTAAPPASAEITLPAGFTAKLYFSGDGFDAGSVTGAGGFPTTTTAAFDEAGMLYLARPGRRYAGGEIEDLWPVYRVPPGGARMTPATERRFLHGPPLWSPQVGAGRAGRDLFVTTFDRDRNLGVLYRLADGRTELLAGGTPVKGSPAQLGQPEGVTADSAGNIYVADRVRGHVVKLDPSGRVVDPRYVAVARPRLLAVDSTDHLWIGADAGNEAPWQRGPGEIWKVTPQGAASRVLTGPNLAGMAFGPGGRLFVADRQAMKIFFVRPDGTPVDFAAFTDGDAPRTLCFAPVTPETRRAGIAGDLFVIALRRGVFRLNEVFRISGPFEGLAAKATSAPGR
jgi:sugar lactone lactonase YvrE